VRALVGALAAVVALGFAGCGGGGRSTHDVFVDDATTICRKANGAFADLEIVDPTAADAAAALEQVSAIGIAALTELRDLKPPEQDQTDVGSWLGTLEQALDEVGYIRELLTDDRVGEALQAAVRADLLTRRAQTLARGVGLDRACRVPRLIPQAEEQSGRAD
jgi:hypothetical protein